MTVSGSYSLKFINICFVSISSVVEILIVDIAMFVYIVAVNLTVSHFI